MEWNLCVYRTDPYLALAHETIKNAKKLQYLTI